jgi:hypothetical protein
MNAKEYLSQAYGIDKVVNSKLEQVKSLHELATKATSTLSDMPHSATRNVHRMEDVIVKMADMESEINRDIENLISLKQEIGAAISVVTNPTYRTLLELRYLCFKDWNSISETMHYDNRYVHKVHGRALREVDSKRQSEVRKDSSKSDLDVV